MNATDYAQMCDADLRVAVFGEEISDDRSDSCGGDIAGKVTVYMDEEKTQMPFGMIENEPFLELFWRETGADCDGEEEEMDFPDGKTYLITLKETR